MNQEQTRLLATKVVQEYKIVLMDALQHSFPLLSKEELNDAINYSILKRYNNPKASLDNNYTKKRFDGTLLDVLDYINSCEPIITSSGVLFKKHKKANNPLSKMIMGFLEKRAKDKAEMFKYPKGSEMFQKYNLFQLLDKLDANAVYGCLGNCSSMYYNIYVAEAVTRQGRSYISCSIMFFESFLGNNVKFNSLNEIITFIHNVCSEKNNRKFADNYILDRDITKAECFYKLLNTVDPLLWIPTEKEMSLIWEYLRGLDKEDINRIYYKNNLYSFVDLPVATDLVKKILCALDVPFINPNKPPKYIKDDLDILVDMIKEYVYYKYPYIDKLDRIEYMQRDICMICDEFASPYYSNIVSKTFSNCWEVLKL